MSKPPQHLERIEVRSRPQLFAWLNEHHARIESVLLVTFKKHTRDCYVSREDVLDALVAYGWTDGRRWALDADRTMQLISPRRTLVWAATYKTRAERLIQEGLMQPAGYASLEAAKAGGRWDESAPIDALEIPEDLSIPFTQNSDAADYWSSCAKSYRRNVLRWLNAAKTNTTRQKRVSIVVGACAQQLRLPHF